MKTLDEGWAECWAAALRIVPEWRGHKVIESMMKTAYCRGRADQVEREKSRIDGIDRSFEPARRLLGQPPIGR